MPFPTFAPVDGVKSPPVELTRQQIASRLGLHRAGVEKIIDAGMLEHPFMASEVDAMANRQRLRVVDGELTVLRTDARADADLTEKPWRRYIGFHTTHTNGELEATSLRWWRSTVETVLGNELFAVTVATFPVALYRITGHLRSFTREGEKHQRHHYEGQLLARVHPGMKIRLEADIPEHLKNPTRQVMESRIVVSSGGPIGYLKPGVSVGDLIQTVQRNQKLSIAQIAEQLHQSPRMVEKAINGKAGYESWRKPLTEMLRT